MTTREKTIWVLAVFLVSLSLLAPLSLRTPKGWPAFYDEGSTLYAARGIAEGKHLYRDMLYFKAPLSYYGLGAVFHLTGPRLDAARLSGALVLALLAALAAGLAQEIGADKNTGFGTRFFLAAMAALPVLSLAVEYIAWHNSWCAALLYLASAWAWVSALKTGHARGFFLAGLLSGMTALTKQPFGFFLGIGVLFSCLVIKFYLKEKILRPLIAWAGGLILVPALWTAWALYQGIALDFFRLAVVYPLSAPGFASGLVRGAGLFAWGGHLLWYLVPPFCMALLAWQAAKKRDAACLSFAILSLCAFGPLFPRMDWAHLRPVLPMALAGIGPLLLPLARDLPEKAQVGLARVCLVAPVLLLASGVIHMEKGTALPISAAGQVRTDPETGRELTGLVRFLQDSTQKDEAVFVYPWAPMVYFLAERDNPTRMRIIWPGQWNSPDHQQEIIRSLKEKNVRTAVSVKGLENFGAGPLSNYAPLLDAHMKAHYKKTGRIGRFELLTRLE